MPATLKAPKQVVFKPQAENGKGFQLIPIERLKPNFQNPRRIFSDDMDEEGRTALQRLAQSVRSEGIIQPLIVTPAGKDGIHTVVCGERRLKASRLAGLSRIPCVIKEGLSENAMLELALVENIQRQDLSPCDEARAASILIQKCGYTQRQFAERLGISPASLSYKLGLLKLSPALQKEISRGALSPTQGRAITQEVERITGGSNVPLKRAKAMEEIHRGISRSGGKLDTEATRALARKAVDQVQGNGGRMNDPHPLNGQKAQAQQFLQILGSVRGMLKPFEEIVRDKAKLDRFIQALIGIQKQPDQLIERSLEVCAKVHAAARQKGVGVRR